MSNYVSFGMPNLAPMQGPVAGVMQGAQFLNNQQASQYALEQMVVDRMQKEAELARYRQMTPHEVDIKGWEGAKAREQTPFAGEYAQGQRGLWQEQQAKGNKAMATWRSEADADNQANVLKGMGNALQSLRVAASSGNLMEAQGGYLNWVKGLPEQYRGFFPNAYNPEIVERQFKALVDSVGHRQKQEELQVQGQTQRDVADIQGRTARDVATINADSREAVARARAEAMSGTTKQNFQQFLTQYAQKKANGTATPQDDQMAQMIERMMYNAAINAGMDPVAYKRWVMEGMGPQGPQGRTPPQSAIPQPGGQQISEQQVRAAGWAYEPDKYDYRIGPNGRLQRAPK